MPTNPARQSDFTSIPVIDLAPARGRRPGGLEAVGRAVRAAAENVGFLYIANHGVPQAVIDNALAAAKTFFDLPLAEKMKVKANHRHRGFLTQGEAVLSAKAKPDLKESFIWGLELPEDDPDVRAGKALMGPNQWPEAAPALRPALSAYYDAILACGDPLLRAFAVGLGLAEDFFTSKYVKPLARGTIIYYPPQPNWMAEDQFGVSPHSDYGCITILWQDDKGGLQARNRAGQWVDAPPIPGTFVINIGDLLARWTNDLFVSTPHRVVNRSGAARYSIPVFFDPNYDTLVSCAEALRMKDEPPHYPPITCGDYVLSRFDSVFSYRKQAM